MKTLVVLILLLALLGAGTFWQATRREHQAKTDFPPQGRLVEVGRTTIHAVIMGQGPDLVMIHGSSGNTRDLTLGVAQDLAQRYRVFVLDRPGLGHSDPLPVGQTTLFDQAQVLQGAAAALGARNPLVLGQSYGGSVAIAWALRAPDTLSGVVLLAAPLMVWEGDAPLLYRITSHPYLGPLARPALTAWVPESYIANTIEGIFAPESAPTGYAKAVGASLSTTRTALAATAYQRVGLKEEIRDMMMSYAQLAMPIEIVHGDADTIVPLNIHSAPFAAQVQQANLTVLSGVGHMPHHTAKASVVAAVDRTARRAGLR